MNEKLKDAVYGFAVGDALGVPFEFKQRGTFKCKDMTGFGTWQQEAGTWSDDTSMLIATCDSIRERGKIVPEDMMERFYQWRYNGKYTARGKVFDVGNTTEQAIRNYKNGMLPLMCGLDDELSNGNGSLMRILPLAFVPEAGWKEIVRVSSLTHGHTISLQKCCEYVRFCKEFVEKRYEIPKRIAKMKEKEIKSTGYVITTLEAALWCVATTSSYKECVLKAVNLGGDTDTIAAVAGGLAGIKYGYDSIPKKWIDKLANKELIDSCLF